jgi:1,4-alpha-glucan branching enzyme
VGDFNDWNPGSNPMKRRKDGGFDTTITIPAGREYQYRYLLDGIHWENDDRADRYVRSPYGDSDNSVVSV